MDSVFLSFSSRDLGDIKPIIDLLDSKKISYFKAPESIPAGSNYAREIPKAIKACEIFLLIISRNAQESIWVEKEIDCAINNRKTILPVQISPQPLSDEFKFYLNNVQIIPWHENMNAALRQLELRLSMLVRGSDENHIDNVIEKKPQEYKKSGVDEELEILRKKKQLGGGVKYHINSEKGDLRPNPFLDDINAKSGPQMTPHRIMARRKNSVSMNKIPEACEQCGGDLTEMHPGTYRCKNCGYMNMDSYQKIKSYLAENGARPVVEISDYTGVSMDVVEYFLLEEQFEMPKNSPVTLFCKRCGSAIRLGRYCDDCKRAIDRGENALSLKDEPKYRYITTNGKGIK